jgi:hypothetical protein
MMMTKRKMRMGIAPDLDDDDDDDKDINELINGNNKGGKGKKDV